MAKKSKKYGGWIIVGVVLVGLAGFGTGGLSGNIRNLGTVGDKDVSVTSYQRALSSQINALSQQFGTALSFQQAQAFGIDRAALNQLVLNRSLDNEASTRGISIGDQNVFERLRSFREFQGANGFNRESYRFALQQTGQTEAQFETEIREDIARTLLQTAIVNGVPDATTYADAVMQYVGEQRSITWATVSVDDLTAPVPGATDADAQAYYDANPDEFTLPETRDITYVWLTPNMIQDDMVVADEAVAQLYQQRSAEFVQPERRLVERLVYVSAARAEEALARLEAGDVAFEDLVVERGLSLSDIDLGDVSREDLRSAGDAVFAAQPGEVVGPFNSSLGPALFRMNAVLAAQETTLEEATPDLRQELAAEAARDVINQNIDQIIDLVAGGAALEDLAERTDMELGTIAWSEDVTDDIAAYEAFRTAAASVAEGDFAEVIDLADGGIFALRLDSITPPALQPLDTVRDEVATLWQEQARQEAIIARAEEIAQAIQPLTGFDTLGLEPTVENDLTRRSFIEGTPPDFNEQMFEMRVGDVRVLDAEDRAIIVRLDDIAPPDAEDDTVVAQRETLAETASAGIAQDIFEAYTTKLQEETDININQATVNAVNAQFQ
ncbi:peptidyl-prolyl cis-trans isomerase [Loktanella agnita]|uniref:peptidyl-prolyl cis-trans isomerase n=1 Tax=Loktanella agnita TaxID=287097 RepID=UPI003987A01E